MKPPCKKERPESKEESKRLIEVETSEQHHGSSWIQQCLKTTSPSIFLTKWANKLFCCFKLVWVCCHLQQKGYFLCSHNTCSSPSLFFFLTSLLEYNCFIILCFSFCFITKWISYTYTYIPLSPPSCISLPPSLSHPSRWSQSTELISLCYAAASH